MPRRSGATLRAAAAGAVLLLLAACGPPAPAVVHGDAYLAHDPARVVDLAGLRVRVVEDLERARLDSALALLCPTRGGGVPADVHAAHAAAWAARDELLGGLVRVVVSTDTLARFAAEVPPGRYRLWADTMVGTTRWSWLQPVTLRAGDSVRLNLSNANPDDDPFRC
jgi:hypothetical protein